MENPGKIDVRDSSNPIPKMGKDRYWYQDLLLFKKHISGKNKVVK